MSRFPLPMTLSHTNTVENWLYNLAPSTQVVQRNLFKSFMSWVQEKGEKFSTFTPDQLIAYQQENKDFEILDSLVKPYIRQAIGTYNTKSTRYNNIRSFFVHNRAELPRDKQFRIRPEVEPIQGTLTAEEIKLTILSCKPMYSAMFFCMFQGAMDQEMITYWSQNGWDSLHEQLGQDIIKIELPGRKARKNIAPFYTFIGSDAISAVKAWLKLRAEMVKAGKIPQDSKVIFCTQFGTPIAKRNLRRYWTNRLIQIGLVSPRTENNKNRKTGKGLHEMRDVLRSLWSKSPASHTVCEYIMGHKIDKLGYDKSFRDVEFYREEYMKAVPYLNLMSSGAAFGRVEKNELDKLRSEVKRLETEKTDELVDMREKMDRMEKMFVEVFDNPAALEETKRRLKKNTD